MSSEIFETRVGNKHFDSAGSGTAQYDGVTLRWVAAIAMELNLGHASALLGLDVEK